MLIVLLLRFLMSSIHLGWECAQSLQLYLTLCNPRDWSLPGFSVHGILQARILVGHHALLQGIFPPQGWNLRLLHLLHW